MLLNRAVSLSGCFYDGAEHIEGSTWFPSSGPCMSCMCVDGVTTCSNVHCLSTCLNQISVPGECCPVCAGTNSPYKQFCACIVLFWKFNVLNVFFFCQTACLKVVCTALERVSTLLVTTVRSATVRYGSSTFCAHMLVCLLYGVFMCCR